MDMIPLDEVARITSSESNEEQPQDTKLFAKKSEFDEDINMPLTPGLSNIVRIETIPEGFNSARTYHLQVNCDYMFACLLCSAASGSMKLACLITT